MAIDKDQLVKLAEAEADAQEQRTAINEAGPELVQAVCLHKRMTMYGLAPLLNVSYPYLHGINKGTSNLSPNMAHKLLDMLEEEEKKEEETEKWIRIKESTSSENGDAATEAPAPLASAST